MSGESKEIEGYVLSKENNSLLIVPNNTIEEKTLETLINEKINTEEIGTDYEGAYFSVSKKVYKKTNIGDHVYMKYKEGAIDDTLPPRIKVKVVEFNVK